MINKELCWEVRAFWRYARREAVLQGRPFSVIVHPNPHLEVRRKAARARWDKR